MEELGYLEEQSMPANRKILIQKFPNKLREKWRTKAIFARTVKVHVSQTLTADQDDIRSSFGHVKDIPPVKQQDQVWRKILKCILKIMR